MPGRLAGAASGDTKRARVLVKSHAKSQSEADHLGITDHSVTAEHSASRADRAQVGGGCLACGHKLQIWRHADCRRIAAGEHTKPIRVTDCRGSVASPLAVAATHRCAHVRILRVAAAEEQDPLDAGEGAREGKDGSHEDSEASCHGRRLGYREVHEEVHGVMSPVRLQPSRGRATHDGT